MLNKFELSLLRLIIWNIGIIVLIFDLAVILRVGEIIADAILSWYQGWTIKRIRNNSRRKADREEEKIFHKTTKDLTIELREALESLAKEYPDKVKILPEPDEKIHAVADISANYAISSIGDQVPSSMVLDEVSSAVCSRCGAAVAIADLGKHYDDTHAGKCSDPNHE